MLFSSIIFLWVFLPIVLIGTNIIYKVSVKNKRINNVNTFLLCCSLIFYAWGGLWYLLIMIGSILLNFFGGRFVKPGAATDAVRKRNLIIVVVLNLLMLFVFKYFNMCVIIIESIMDQGGIKGLWHSILYMEGTGKLGLPEIVLPIGISFFTFQSMSYVIDVYRGNASVQDSLRDFALYVSLFPQLIAGPIVRYSDVAEQLRGRVRKTSKVYEGIRRFCYGLAKKVILADCFGAVVDEIWKLDIDKLGGPLAWMGMVFYTLQIYYDFSGYSDMAIGLGAMLGFDFKENFNYPYVSTSIQEFWRRWHMSLSGWFKEYVYFPLGGSRQGMKKTCLNVFIVFLLTGLWHGANFTFLFWGLFYAFWLILERLFLGKWLKENKFKWINHIYTMFLVMIAWVFFRSDNIAQGFTFVGQLFKGISSTYSVFSYISVERTIMFIAAVFLGGIMQERCTGLIARVKSWKNYIYIDFAFMMVLLFICILKMVSGTYSAFIYFQF